MFKIEEIKELIHLIDKSSVARFELEQDAARIIIVKNGDSTHGEVQPARIEPATAAEKVNSEDAKDNLYIVTSPVVGVFYAAGEPGAEAFVKLGDKVTQDKIVCIVEVMKLFNEVEAGMNGEIVDVLVKDGDFVEYGQPLFVIRPE